MRPSRSVRRSPGTRRTGTRTAALAVLTVLFTGPALPAGPASAQEGGTGQDDAAQDDAAPAEGAGERLGLGGDPGLPADAVVPFRAGVADTLTFDASVQNLGDTRVGLTVRSDGPDGVSVTLADAFVAPLDPGEQRRIPLVLTVDDLLPVGDHPVRNASRYQTNADASQSTSAKAGASAFSWRLGNAGTGGNSGGGTGGSGGAGGGGGIFSGRPAYYDTRNAPRITSTASIGGAGTSPGGFGGGGGSNNNGIFLGAGGGGGYSGGGGAGSYDSLTIGGGGGSYANQNYAVDGATIRTNSSGNYGSGSVTISTAD